MVTTSRVRGSSNDGESIQSFQTIQSDSKVSEEDVMGTRVGEKLKSGFLDEPRSNVIVKLKWPHMNQNPRSNVIVKLKWPHMNQNPRYVTTALTFNQLSFQ